MRIYIPDMDEFFAWMDKQDYRYVVLRGYLDFDKAYPAHGAKEDVDLLVEDKALNDIREHYHMVRKRKGVKCDFYNVSGHFDGNYLDHAYYPVALSERILENRQMWKQRFYVPDNETHLYSLIFHIAYQKAEASKIDIDDAQKSLQSKYCQELDGICSALSLKLDYTLNAFHQLLQDKGYSIEYMALVKYLQNDFARGRKGYFMASVCNQWPGELNMYVIRKIAVKQEMESKLLQALRDQYMIISVKDIPWVTRVSKSKHMRGGKWKRGGKPYIAVIVFDPCPQEPAPEDKKIHPFVFNSRQFMKRSLREWFAAETGVRIKDNPIHSTDNEAEAVGHFPLFFTVAEQQALFKKIDEKREQLLIAQEEAD